MGSFAVGDVLLVGFPFSNLRQTKLRPAVVIGLSDYSNLILCQITSKSPDLLSSVKITSSDLDNPAVLPQTSYIRANKIFTSDPELIVKKLGRLESPARSKLHAKLTRLFEDLGSVR